MISLSMNKLLDHLLCVIVALLVKNKESSLVRFRLVLLNHLSPGVTLVQSLRVTHHEEEMSWTSNRDIEAPYICQET